MLFFGGHKLNRHLTATKIISKSPSHFCQIYIFDFLVAYMRLFKLIFRSVYRSVHPLVGQAVEICAEKLFKPHHCPCPPVRNWCCCLWFRSLLYHRATGGNRRPTWEHTNSLSWIAGVLNNLLSTDSVLLRAPPTSIMVTSTSDSLNDHDSNLRYRVVLTQLKTFLTRVSILT